MSGVKGLVIGDPHFQVNNLLDVDAFITKTETAVRRLKPDFIVCLGDLLDQHERIHVDPLTRANRFLEMLARHALTFLLVGNHDRRNNSDFMSDIHPFTGLRHCPNLVIVDYATKYEVTGKNGAKANFLFVPYVAPGRLYEALDCIDLGELGEETWRSPSIDAIFCHQEFKGVQMGPIKSEHGDVWDVSWPVVISGHIHDYQRLQPNLLYVGTPLQHTFSEAPNKAITLFNFNPDCDAQAVPLEEVTSLEALKPEALSRIRYARINLGLRTKRTVTLAVADLGSFKPLPNELTRLIVKGTVSELKALDKSRQLHDLTKAGVKIARLPIEEASPERETGSAVEAKDVGFLQLFRDLIADDKELVPHFDRLFNHVQSC
jgi:DNA repair exonuclease SbcCD nuclease subunit